jgi:hypothetical protein
VDLGRRVGIDDDDSDFREEVKWRYRRKIRLLTTPASPEVLKNGRDGATSGQTLLRSGLPSLLVAVLILLAVTAGIYYVVESSATRPA